MTTTPAIVVLSGTPWHGPYRKAVVEISRRWASSREVVFVDFPETVASAARKGELPAPWVTSTSEGAVRRIVPPVMLPHNALPPGPAHRAVLGLDRALYQRAGLAATSGLGPFVLVNAWNPVLGGGLVGRLGEERAIYWCYDEISGAPWNARHGVAAERELLARVDAVVVTSPGLARTKGALHPRVALVPNGVDYDHFAPAASTDFPVDPALRDLRRPVAGYLGNVDARVDVALLAAVARALPSVTVAVVGPVATEIAPLRALPNVRFVGPVPAERLPGVVAGFDVGLIPFVRDTFTAAVYPLKVHEYLAAGRPVVATDFAPLADVAAEVRVAGSAGGFVEALRQALAEGRARIPERQALARAATWEGRADRWLELLDALVAERRAA